MAGLDLTYGVNMSDSAVCFIRDYRASRSDRWTPPPIWTEVAMVVHEALRRSDSLMRDARKHLGFSLRAKTVHEPVRAMHHIPHAINWMLRANDEYARAIE